jgi:hypothetical protein
VDNHRAARAASPLNWIDRFLRFCCENLRYARLFFFFKISPIFIQVGSMKGRVPVWLILVFNYL